MKEKERKVNKSVCVNEDEKEREREREREREMFTLGDCLSYTRRHTLGSLDAI